jgi:hypothetical protein
MVCGTLQALHANRDDHHVRERAIELLEIFSMVTDGRLSACEHYGIGGSISGKLMAHVGAQYIDREGLRALETPPVTDT